MCGIFACFNYGGDPKQFRALMIELAKRMRHRGPDWAGVKIIGNNCLCHERLSIVDVVNGDQPLISQCKNSQVVAVSNGEIYNHKKLRKQLKSHHDFSTQSDSEIIVHLYEECGDETPKYLDGVFAFAAFDGDNYLVARDPIGVIPLYQGWGRDGSIWFASEMKSLMDTCYRIENFPPGHYYSSRNYKLTQWYKPLWYNECIILNKPLDLMLLRNAFIQSVEKRLMSDVPYGVLLSGGLDSSLVASVMTRLIKFSDTITGLPVKQAKITNGDNGNAVIIPDGLSLTALPVLHSFSIGLPTSTDLKAAREVSKFLGTKHHEFHFTVQEGIDNLSDVIYHLETYDVTTIRASTPMYLMARKIKALGIKMVLSGEGADEIFGGYLYFHQAPDEIDFHKETVKRVKNLHLSDCLRANKSTMAWGLEVRVPFLDREFLNVAMSVTPREKLCVPGERIEKYIMRKAFDEPDDPYLPHNILWRQKEQFSDGVGYSWIDSLKKFAEGQITDQELASAESTYPYDTPTTKEAYYYRKVFEKLFPNSACETTVKRWVPRLDWGCSMDPSGRAQTVHQSAYKVKVNAA